MTDCGAGTDPLSDALPEIPPFFMPGIDPQKLDAEIERIAQGDRGALVYSINYEHEGKRFRVTVGERRLEQRLIPRSERYGTSFDTGATVYAIVYTPTLIEVYELPDQRSEWGNPSLVGPGEIRGVVPFADAPRPPPELQPYHSW